jgi:hypothetical protein
MSPAEAASIACTLNATNFRSRRAKLANLNRTALVSYRRNDLRLELLYAVEARPQVLEMVRADCTCCAFLTFEVHEEPDTLRVVVEAPASAREAADSMFEALYSTAARQGTYDCNTASASTGRLIGASAALAATGALACGVCCVLPFALPAAVLAVSGGVLGWFAKATPWAMSIALFAVLAGWTWVVLQSVQTKRPPARSTVLTVGLATLVIAAAGVWWHFEREIIHLLR